MHTVALFGEAQKGNFRTGYYCTTLTQLSEFLGEPPSKECRGLALAVQTLLYERGVLYFRVREEGFSTPDYLSGIGLLLNGTNCPPFSAICMPGVGNSEVIEATNSLCHSRKIFLIFNEQDLYDYLTDRSPQK